MRYKDSTATFVIPFYSENYDYSKSYFDKTLYSIFNQTDTNWHIVIVDDASPCNEIKVYLNEIAKSSSSKITVIFKDINEGAGVARNIGIKCAYDNESPFILFNDADDVSDKRRLEVVRNIFVNDNEAGVVYSTFKVIDENDIIVPKEKLTQSILEILESHEDGPVEGFDIWIEIGTKTGYVNCTSGTAVKTEIAYNYPFPKERVSEDAHTWMRYSASGTKFVYNSDIPFLYRIPANVSGSASRVREGGKHNFYSRMAQVNEQGFKESINIALNRLNISRTKQDNLMIKYYIKLAETFAKEDEQELALEQIAKAMNISEEITKISLANKTMSFYKWLP